MEKFVFVVLAYLVGSIPFSYLLGKLIKGEDIRKKGSGNLGATNAYRVFGKLVGTLVLVLDTAKGGIIIALMMYTGIFVGYDLFHPLVYGLFAVLGHIFPIWFKFKGGKGVASSFGLLLAYNPLIAIIVIPIFILTEFLTRYVSVASTVASVFSLIYALVYVLIRQDDWIFLVVTFVIVSLIIFKHRSNYIRLRNHQENRVRLFDWFDRLLEKRKKASDNKDI
ncbi:MAG: glycerol-3-phosphate 1-O-acyltransferase PlsY [Candidatus Izemoplasmatales bacterium]|nr:glycerol-3-phosphate 1-O-acyltransferase PlsY [Candidatus Izemoplasmatales bacterium]